LREEKQRSMPIWLIETRAAQPLGGARVDAAMNWKVFARWTGDRNFIAVKRNDQDGGGPASPTLAPRFLHRTSRGFGVAFVNDDFQRELASADE
jgi:hypothetical protein